MNHVGLFVHVFICALREPELDVLVLSMVLVFDSLQLPVYYTAKKYVNVFRHRKWCTEGEIRLSRLA